MMTIIIVLLALLGVVLGSYAGASVWRLRARQLRTDKDNDEKVDTKEFKRLKPLMNIKLSKDRSQCLSCNHTLAWYDLLPLASWVSTKGKCRYCGERIGTFEPLMEIGMALAFVVTYAAWAMMGAPVFVLALLILSTFFLVILFAYDAKWFILPDVIVFPLIATSAIILIYKLASSSDVSSTLLSTVGAVVILSGLYLVLWLISKGQWIGFGDVKLGLALGLLLADWQLAFLALFLANLIGTLIVIPGLLSKRMTRKTQVPFGPLLIAGYAIAMLIGPMIIEAYVTLSTSVLF